MSSLNPCDSPREPLPAESGNLSQESYDAWVVEMIRRHCPDVFGVIERHEFQGNTFVQAVREDSRGQRYRVALSTYGRELTVSCEAFHSHFDQFEEDDHEQEFLDAIEWIRDLVNDRILVFTEMEGNRVLSATAADPSYAVAPSQGRRIEVFSFSGELDRVIEQA